MNTPDRILATSQSIHCVGDRKTSERAAWGRFKQVARAGLLGAFLMASGGQALAGQAPADVGATRTQTAQAGAMVVAQHPARFVAGVLDGDQGLTTAQGTVEMQGLLQQWREGNVAMDRIFELTKVMLITQSPTIARTDAAQAAAQRRAQDTAGIFKVSNDNEARAFLKDHSLEALIDRGVLEADGVAPYDVVGDGSLQATLDLLDQVSYDGSSTGGWRPAGGQSEDTGMPQAKQALLDAVDQAGLAGLTVPLPYWGSSQQIQRLADQVVQANADMQKVTGWQGPVLGLNGRVHLSIGQPADMAVTYAQSKTGEDTMIGIVGAWDNVGHELTHAIDMAMRMEKGLPALRSGASRASEGVLSESSRTLTEALELGQLNTGRLGQLSEWGHLNQELKRVGSTMEAPWHDQVDVLVDRLASDDIDSKVLRDYFTRSWEQVAYAFSAYSDYVLQNDANTVLAADGSNHDGIRTPSMEEAAAAAPIWQRTLYLVNQQWWGPQMLASASVQHEHESKVVLAATNGGGLGQLLAQRRAGQTTTTVPELARPRAMTAH